MRQTGRTTWAMVRFLGHTLQSDKPGGVFVSPTQPMAKYSFHQFIDIIQTISKGKATFKVSKSKMMVEFMGKSFEFLSAEQLSFKKPKPEIIIDDHTVNEYEFMKYRIPNELSRL